MKVTGSTTSSTEKTRDTGKTSKTGPVAESKGKSVDKSARSGDSENIEISARAKENAQAKSVAKNAPDVNEEKIAKLKAAIESNSYKVDADALADRLVDEHLSSRF